jgi:addiction module RelE/StbE family toxin
MPAASRLRWSRRALADLDRIARHIAADKPLAAIEFVAAVRTSVERLDAFPLLGRAGALDDTRELVVHRNYLVTYRVRGGEVQVLQVWHVARNRPRGGRR